MENGKRHENHRPAINNLFLKFSELSLLNILSNSQFYNKNSFVMEII